MNSCEKVAEGTIESLGQSLEQLIGLKYVNLNFSG